MQLSKYAHFNTTVNMKSVFVRSFLQINLLYTRVVIVEQRKCYFVLNNATLNLLSFCRTCFLESSSDLNVTNSSDTFEVYDSGHLETRNSPKLIMIPPCNNVFKKTRLELQKTTVQTSL